MQPRRMTNLQQAHAERIHRELVANLEAASRQTDTIAQEIEEGKNVRTPKGEPSKLPDAKNPKGLIELLNTTERAAVEHIRAITRLRAAINKASQRQIKS